MCDQLDSIEMSFWDSPIPRMLLLSGRAKSRFLLPEVIRLEFTHSSTAVSYWWHVAHTLQSGWKVLAHLAATDSADLKALADRLKALKFDTPSVTRPEFDSKHPSGGKSIM